MDFNQKEDGWILVRKDGKAQNILPGMMFVGREECDITLQSSSSDKRHAVLFFDTKNREIHIKDLNSLTGTYVNGIRIPEQTYVRLKLMDNLRFGYGPDIFRIQSHKQSSHQSLPSQKMPEKRAAPTRVENVQEMLRNCPTTSVAKTETSRARDGRKGNLHDSLEDLKHHSSSPSGSKSLESNNLECPSVSPAFSSLTFKRSNTRSLCSPSDPNSPSSSMSQENSSPVEDKQCKTPQSSGYPSTSPNRLDELLCSPVADRSLASPQQSREEESPTESAPLAMAFTVAFDNPTPKKRFNIKDSISKYAPRKAEAERASRQKQSKSGDPVPKKAPEQLTPDVCQVELRKKKSPDNPNGECGFQLKSENEPKLSNGATYLIQKMFRAEKQSPVEAQPLNEELKCSAVSGSSAPNTSSNPKSAKEGRPSGNEDAKSDTGTYTVDEELNNKLVEEARQRIDEVFGIVSAANMNSQSVAKVLSEKSVTNPQQLKQEESLQSDNTSSSDNREKQVPVIAPVRTKRRLPTPPVLTSVELSSPVSNEKPFLPAYGTYTAKGRPHTMLPTVARESEKTLTEKISLSLPSKRLTINNLELLQNSCSSNAKAHAVINGHPDFSSRRTPPYGGTWRRSPWNLSGSDMDLDQMKIETSSVLSDVSASTEPPTMNPGFGKEVGPQMKFNRAFALRRARLGLETELPPASKSLVSRDSKPLKETSRPTPASLSPFSRQDGGRFSLRLPKSSSKPTVKQVSKSVVPKTAPVTAQKYGHNRMSGDPTKTFLRKSINQTSSAGESSLVKGSVNRPPFQRASSFTSNEETSLEAGLRHPRSFQLKQHDRHSINVMRSSPRASPVAPTRDSSDELCGKDSRASPKPMEKADLSALDNLVIQATHQLSAKLRTISYHLLVKERDKFTEDSSERLMIDEVLPRVSENEASTCANCNERGVSQDLANILKNLKRVEQSLKVLTVVVDEERMDHRRLHNHHNHMPETEESFYVVDV